MDDIGRAPTLQNIRGNMTIALFIGVVITIGITITVGTMDILPVTVVILMMNSLSIDGMF